MGQNGLSSRPRKDGGFVIGSRQSDKLEPTSPMRLQRFEQESRMTHRCVARSACRGSPVPVAQGREGVAKPSQFSTEHLLEVRRLPCRAVYDRPWWDCCVARRPAGPHQQS